MKVVFGFIILLIFVVGIGFGVKSVVLKIKSIVRASRERDSKKSTDVETEEVATPLSDDTSVKEVEKIDECNRNRNS